MIYGIWPGVLGLDNVSFEATDCPPEDPQATLAALESLQGEAGAFYVRCYRHFGTGSDTGSPLADTPARPATYAGNGRLIDLVACYQSSVADPDGFAEFVREAVRDVESWGGGKLQIGEELNMPAPFDGGSPGCFEAVDRGIAAALDERDRLRADVLIGVNSAGPADPGFWRILADALGPDHLAALDYIGLDAFPDVFHPVPHAKIPGAVNYLLERFRTVTTDVGVPDSTPVHVTETGWPTGPDHDEATQSVVLTSVVRAVVESPVGVDALEFFGLRDGRSDGPRTSRFGVLRDDYTRKPAFDALRELISAP